VQLTLLHNPKAGVDGNDVDALVALLADAGHAVVTYASVKERSWKDALRVPADLVVVAGGDGTVQKVFRELAGSPALATLLPTGSANNVARTLWGYGGEEPEEIVAAWPRAQRRAYLLGEAAGPAGGERFVEAVGGGVFADVLARAEQTDAEPDGEEKLAFGLRLVRDVLSEAAAAAWELEADGVDLSGELLAVEAMRIREAGPHVVLAPDADPGDRRLDLVRVRPEDRERLLAYVDARLAGSRPEPPGLPVVRAGRIALRPPLGCTTHLDDEPWPDEETASGEMIVVAAGPRIELLLPRAG
jgi:diacylglycerol kinase (ATP)